MQKKTIYNIMKNNINNCYLVIKVCSTTLHNTLFTVKCQLLKNHNFKTYMLFTFCLISI